MENRGWARPVVGPRGSGHLGTFPPVDLESHEPVAGGMAPNTAKPVCPFFVTLTKPKPPLLRSLTRTSLFR